jgi:DNA helicase-2/ATP-dependent DNA helicase PcrA
MQDTNEIQLSLALLLARACGNIAVVGDPDQTIYRLLRILCIRQLSQRCSWRNANPKGFSDLKKTYPSLVEIFLDQNYRSSPEIVQCGCAIINANKSVWKSASSSKF